MTDTRSWWPDGYGEDPAFQVRRIVYGNVTGGDYVRGSSILTLPHTALRYPTTVAGAAEALNRAILHVRVKNHYIRQEPVYADDGSVERYINWREGDIEVTWGWPSSIQDTWTDVALVRSAFGRPSTVNDGQTVMSGARAAFYRHNQDGSLILDDTGNPTLEIPPIFTDVGLPTGRWYHYGLFFKISQVEWIQGMLDSTLLPRDLHHADHLWDNVPPYYRWTDENSMVGNGYLQQFLSVFGFELDTAREYIESWQHVYDVDWSPIRLLRKLGPNFNYDYEQGVGDIRYRSMFSELGRFYEIRGTQDCLEGVVRRFSKYDCTVVTGSNQMLLPDDSDFYSGTGNWGVVLDQTDAPGAGYLAKDKVTLTSVPNTTIVPPAGQGRRAMRVTTLKADAATDIGIACGDSYVTVDGGVTFKEVPPDHGGIPIGPGLSYGFTVWVNAVIIPAALQVSLMFFDVKNVLIGTASSATPSTAVSVANTWQSFTVGPPTVPPAGAVYVVPYILFDVRTDDAGFPTTSPPIYLAGAMVYASQTVGEALGPPPNRYLTISDPGEPLGSTLNFKGTLTGAATVLPTVHATNDAYVLTPAPVPTAAPNFTGVTPSRVAQNNDTIYWNGTAWVNIGTVPSTFLPFLLGAPS